MRITEKNILNKLYRENILASITMCNYYEISFAERNNQKRANYFKKCKDKIINKVVSVINEYKAKTKEVEELGERIENIVSPKETYEDLAKEYEKLSKKYTSENVKDLDTFYKLVMTTYYSEKDGKPVKFEDIPEEIREGIDYEFSTDVYVNFFKYTNLGDDLSYLYYRSRIIGRDMPMFITKELKQKYCDALEAIYGDPTDYTYPESSKIPEYRKLYSVKVNPRIKELYESVFPEFNFRYEDIEEDPLVYELDFDKYREYFEE